MSTNITEEHRRAFEALTSGDHDNFALFSCFCNHQPAAAIIAVNECASAEETGGKGASRNEGAAPANGRRACA